MEELEKTLKSLPELLRQREEALVQRERELERRQANLEKEHPNLGQPSDVLRLNVGGKKIDVLRRTLTQVEGSMLESRFSGRWDDSLEKDADGNIFVDQPDKLFVPIVDFLRAKQCETPLAKITRPPRLEGKAQDDFERMVEYYGITLSIYAIGIYRLENKDENTPSGSPDWTICGQGESIIESDNEWATYCLQPYFYSHHRFVDSFEVTLEQCSTAQIGWIDSDGSRMPAYRTSETGRGVGYGSTSIALDCLKSTLVVSGNSSTLLSGGVSVKEGCAIRSEKSGAHWYVDGILVASTSLKGDNVLELQKESILNKKRWIPCITIKGNCRVSKIELMV